FDKSLAARVRKVAMHDPRKSIHRFTADKNVEFDKVGDPISGEVVVKRRIAARDGLQAIIEIQNDFVQRHLVSEQHTTGRDVFKALLDAAFFLDQFQDWANEFIRAQYERRDYGLFDLRDDLRLREFRRIVDFFDRAAGPRDAIPHTGRR